MVRIFMNDRETILSLEKRERARYTLANSSTSAS